MCCDDCDPGGRTGDSADLIGQGLYSMGFMHQMGYGVKQDLNMAKRYYDDAATADDNAM